VGKEIDPPMVWTDPSPNDDDPKTPGATSGGSLDPDAPQDSAETKNPGIEIEVEPVSPHALLDDCKNQEDEEESDEPPDLHPAIYGISFESSELVQTCIVAALGVGLGYLAIWCMFDKGDGKGNAAEPGEGGWLFTLLIVYLFGTIGGMIFRRIEIKGTKMPGLVGMLVGGFLIRNIWPAVDEGHDKKLDSTLRNIALAIILIRAGLGLSLKSLMDLKWTMAALSTLPAVAEATVAMALTMPIFGFSVEWGFMTGFILADVSPAVTVPLLLKFQEEGYGAKKGIPSILLAGGAFNSVFAITCYGVVQGFNFSGSGTPIWETILRGVMDVIGGVLCGVLAGWIICNVSSKLNTYYRFTITFVFALVLIFALKEDPIKSTGGNALAVLVMGLTIANLWPDAEFEGMKAVFNMVWTFVGECALFSLLGASLSVAMLDGETVGLGLLIIFTALLIRAIIAVAVVSIGTDWAVKDRIFTAITWCPKATVQAALSGVALDYVREHPDEFTPISEYNDAESKAQRLKTIAILSIIATAPLFAALMDWGGYNLLEPPETPMDPTPLAEVKLVSAIKEELADLPIADVPIDEPLLEEPALATTDPGVRQRMRSRAATEKVVDGTRERINTHLKRERQNTRNTTGILDADGSLRKVWK